MPVKPDLTLGVEITTADGSHFQWGKGSIVPGDVPQGLSFRTKLGDGFSDASVTLSRRIDLDYPDINLYDNVVFYGADGSTAYEGRVGANPRSIGDTHSMSVVIAGWMAHTRDRKFQEIYVDRDPGRWAGPGLNRQIRSVVISAETLGVITTSTDSGGLTWNTPADALVDKTNDELVYGVGLPVGLIGYRGARTGAFTNFEAPTLFASDLDDFSSADSYGLTLDDTLRSQILTTAQRKYIMLRTRCSPGVTPGATWQQRYSKLAVYGTSGVPTQDNDTEPDGVFASDVIRDIIARFCPQLNANGVTATTYVIGHLAFMDRTDPFDAIAEVNKYHRWQFGVWENRTLTYGPTDLSDYDWAVDHYEHGTGVFLQGDSTDDGAFNGICVTFTDLQTGNQSTLTPETNPELADTDPENPANRHGIDHWDEITLSSPALSADAVAIASAALTEKNTPKGQGSFEIKGHIKDRAGHWQQGWKPRAGQTVAMTSSASLSDRPRLISETDWDQDTKTLTITVEDVAQNVPAWMDRQNTALVAAGLG